MEIKKINSVRKIIFYFLLIMLAVIVISFLFLNIVQPKDSTNNGFFVTLNGTIDIISKNINQYPYVYIYYPHYNLQRLAEGETIKFSSIEWKENKGKYSITFWVPIEMEIIITGNPGGCNYNKTYISKENNIQVINLIVDESKCYEELKIPTRKDEIIKGAEKLFGKIRNEMNYVNISKYEEEQIRNDLRSGEQEISDFNYESDENKSILHAYNSYWLGWRADYLLQLSELQNCVKEASPLIQEDSCIIIPYNIKTKIIDANMTYTFFNNSWILKENVYDVNTVEESKNNIQVIYKERDQLRSEVGDCKNSLDIVKESYKNQENTCKMRKTAFTILTLSQVLALIALGFIIYLPIRRWIEK